MHIEIEPIKTELKELAGSLKCSIKLDRHINVGSSFRETDEGYEIKINPSRIRGRHQLDNHLNSLRRCLTL